MNEALYREMYDLEERFWWFVAKRNILLHLIDRYHRPLPGRRSTACDIGCGCGALLSRLATEFDAVGLDSSPAARQFCGQRGLEVREGHLPDAIPFQEGAFDIVVLSDVLEHVQADAASVATAVRLLRPGGLLVCTVPAYQWLYTRRDTFHHHYRRYGYRDFKRLFAPHPLDVQILSFYNALLFLPMAAVRVLTRELGMDKEAPDIRVPHRALNGALRAVFEAEKRLLPRIRLPVGGSLISVHRRRFP
ncbi:MAG TPA: class I SAM-dependent methyltransferase [Phycisphaerae bacterium]|nr:class I SAM-dependent methyltransferase [Phycisphaerae bacterium]